MPTDLPPPPFAGFPPAALRFFEELARHQDRAWMGAHKADYETAVRGPLAALVADVSTRLAGAGSPLRGDARGSVFRLHRDTRFSADKRPYHTHASAVWTRAAQKHAPGVLYFHLDPAGSFAAAGFFRPGPEVLTPLRTGLARAPDVWTGMVADLTGRGLTLQREDTLVRAPRGFEDADPAVADDLKLKSWIVRRELSPEALGRAGLVEALADLAGTSRELLGFGWSALDGPGAV